MSWWRMNPKNLRRRAPGALSSRRIFFGKRFRPIVGPKVRQSYSVDAARGSGFAAFALRGRVSGSIPRLKSSLVQRRAAYPSQRSVNRWTRSSASWIGQANSLWRLTLLAPSPQAAIILIADPNPQLSFLATPPVISTLPLPARFRPTGHISTAMSSAGSATLAAPYFPLLLVQTLASSISHRTPGMDSATLLGSARFPGVCPRLLTPSIPLQLCMRSFRHGRDLFPPLRRDGVRYPASAFC